MVLTIQLEGALPDAGVYSELHSPYRLPLTKFLNRYKTEAVDYFLLRLKEPAPYRRFATPVFNFEAFQDFPGWTGLGGFESK